MRIDIQSVNFVADKKLKEFISSKLEKLENFHDKIINAEVFLKVQNTSSKENKLIETKLVVPGDEIIVKKTCKTFEEGTDISMDTLKRNLKRSKQKHTDH